MQMLADFFPILIFFIVFKIWGVFAATAAAIVVSIIQVIFYRVKHGKFEKMQLITLAIIVILGGATLIAHNDIFIKWKVSVVNWVFGIVLLATQWSDMPLMKRLLSQKINLPDQVWKKLNLSWAIFFIVMGIINIYVAYHTSTATWVNFKLFGVLGLTVLFAIGQAFFLAKHIKE